MKNMKSAWKQVHLVPLLLELPYKQKREDDFINQALKSDIPLPQETVRKKELTTGIVTSDSAIEKIKARSGFVQPGPQSNKRGRRPSVTAVTSPTPVTAISPQTSVTDGGDLSQTVSQRRRGGRPRQTPPPSPTITENPTQSVSQGRKRGRKQ